MELGSVMDWLKETPEGKAITRHETNRLIEQRKEWASQRQHALDEWNKVSPTLIENENLTLAQLERAKEKAAEIVREATEAHRKNQILREQAQDKRDREAGPAEASLRRTASPKIDEFARALERRRRELEAKNEYGPNHFTGGEMAIASTHDSVQQAALRILEIIREELPRLALEALSDEEVEARFKRLEQSIPHIEMRPL